MQELAWVIDFRFPYPASCTPAQLLTILKRLAVDWPGMPKFPWRVTRNIHKFLGRPPVNFYYLMIHRCLMGCAAHLVLNATFASREAVLTMILREKVEIIGMLRLLLIDAIRAEVKRTGVPYIPDCSGPEDGHKHLSAAEIEKRRRDFQACIDGAIEDFVKILDLASLSGGLKGEIMGRTFRTWVRGGDMPDVVTLQVQVEKTVEGLVLHPCQEEIMRLVEAGRTLPKLVVEHARGGGGRAGCPRSDVSPVGTGQRPSREIGDPKAAVNPSAELRASSEQSTVSGQSSVEMVGESVRDGQGSECIMRPGHDWDEVVLHGETISLRNRQKAKEFMRLLWSKGAKRHSQAILVGKRFEKPSSLFLPGGRYVRNGTGSNGREVAVGSELGALIRRVYQEGVGKVPPAKKGKGCAMYYLRVFRDSDVT